MEHRVIEQQVNVEVNSSTQIKEGSYMACTYLILFCKTSEIEVSLRILQNVIQAN